MNWSEHPEARAELLGAAEYLDERRAGLGNELIDRVETAIEDILAMPEAWPLVSSPDGQLQLRSRVIRPFRYRIVYYIAAAGIRVVAYAHESQEPGYWRKRLGA